MLVRDTEKTGVSQHDIRFLEPGSHHPREKNRAVYSSHRPFAYAPAATRTLTEIPSPAMADDPTSDAPSVETPAGAAGPATNPNTAPQGQTSNAPSSDVPNAEGALPLPDDSNGEATLSYTPGAPSAPPNAPDMPNAPTVPADTRSAPSDALLPLGSIVSESREVYTPPPH
jgi:hypothetical protein